MNELKMINFPAGIYFFKFSNRSIGKICEIYSKLTVKVPEQYQRRHSDVFIINFEQFSKIILVFPLLNLNK